MSASPPIPIAYTATCRNHLALLRTVLRVLGKATAPLHGVSRISFGTLQRRCMAQGFSSAETQSPEFHSGHSSFASWSPDLSALAKTSSSMPSSPAISLN